MTTKAIILTASLVLVPGAANAQTKPAPQPAATQTATPAPTSLFGGTLDIGGLFTGTDGDQARYERYRDTRDGLYSSITLNRHSDTYLFDASAYHIGYRDQRYRANFLGRRVDANFAFVSLPLNFSYITRTPYSSNGSTLTLDDSAQRSVQGATNSTTDGVVGVPCAPGGPPASCSNPTQAGQAKANRSIYNNLATEFDLRHTRRNTALDVNYEATRTVDIDATFLSSDRSGEQPWNASFAFNNAVEVPQPIDQRTNDLKLGATWANERSMFRVGWDGSWFNNAFQSLTWDNPIFLTDYNNGLLPPNGPYDPSGYSNGNGPAQGRMALAPDNWMSVVSGTGLYKLARRSTINGTLQFTTQNQDDQLIPFTINPLIGSNPAVLAAFPHLAQLPRQTAEAKATGTNALIAFNSRPYQRVNVAVRYRYNKRNVKTPIFDATEYVRFDAVPEEIEEGFSPQFDNSRKLFDANVSYVTSGWGTVRVGYGHEGIERQGRGFADVGEHIFRLTYDAYSNQYVTVRASFDYGHRRGEGFVEAESGNDDEGPAVGPGGTQPTLRYYDEADRNRKRGSVVFSVAPRDTYDVFFQFAGIRDEFLTDDSAPVSRPGELFGLLEQTVYNWNLGINFHPSGTVSAGASYGRDMFGSFQKSRNASPPPDPTWTDPSRDWTLDNDDTANNFSVFADLLQTIEKTDIHFMYTFADSDNSFVHGGPRIASLTSAGQFIPLPNVTNSWHRATVDVQYFVTNRTGIGAGWYFEKLDVSDFNTIDTNGPVGFAEATGDPRIDWLGGLIMGYGNRPYTGNTVYLRVLYKF
jgi:putative beta-barrel porin MtrB/PioB